MRSTIYSLGRRCRRCFRAALIDVAILRTWIATVGQRSGEQRIARLFCELQALLDAIGLAPAGVATLPLTQDVSDAVGLSIVHTNRSIKSLARWGLLTFRGGTLVLHDAKGLAIICGVKPNYLHLPLRCTNPTNDE